MSFSRSKFPGRLAKRSHHHNRERFSFRDGRILSEIEIQLKRNKEDPHSPIKELQLLEQGKQEAELKKRNDESALVASQTATNLKAFRSLFGSSDESEEEFPGFEELGPYTEKIKSKLREKLGKIQRDIFSLQTEILTNGNHLLNEFNEIEQKLPNFTSALPIPVSKTRTKELNEAFAKRRMPPPIATKVRRSGRLSSLLPLDLEKPNTSVLCINSIPMVKHVSEIPQPLDGTSSSGKFLVETDGSSCSEEDEEIESISGIVSPIPDVLQTSARELIQLNRCPVQMDDEQGFPIIIDTARGSIPPKPLCFSCGSAGIEQLIYCWSCCEPYHPFCSGDDSLLSSYVSRILPKTKSLRSSVNDDTSNDLHQLTTETQAQIPIYYNRTDPHLKSESLDNPLRSLLSPPLTPMPVELDLENEKESELQRLLMHWTCRRCYMCSLCQSHLPPSFDRQGHDNDINNEFLKCFSCPRVIHSTCYIGTKKLSNSYVKEKWVCDECFKCRSCGRKIEQRTLTGGAAARGKDQGSQMLCLDCFRQKQKGSYCPICDVCYDDNDYDTRMMECATCQRWVHAKCESVTEEQYQILSNLPESIEYICRLCEDPSTVFWRQAVAMELNNGCESVLRIFQKKAISTCRKRRVLQPSLEDNIQPIVSDRLETFDKFENVVIPPVLSPSAKENKIVRKLFPKEQEILPVKSTDLTSSNQLELKILGKELSIVLHDCRKYSIGLGEQTKVNLSLPHKLFEDVKIEVPEHRTPIKCVSVPVQPIAPMSVSPSKKINSLLDSVLKKLQLNFSSVMSVYTETVREIELLECDESNVRNLKDHFVSAVKEVFPWFSPDHQNNFQERTLNTDDKSIKSLFLSPDDSFSLSLKNEMNQASNNLSMIFKTIPTNQQPMGCNPFQEVYWDIGKEKDYRRCSFCQDIGDFPPDFSGRLLWAGLCDWVHVNCALWSSEVWEEEDGALQQVGVALGRSKSLSCGICERKGASVSCCAQYCRKSFHFPCALNSACSLMEDKRIFCPEHVSKAKGIRQQDMQVLRQVYIDTDWLRKKERSAWSTDLSVFIGSLRIDHLGQIFPLSVYKSSTENLEKNPTALVPLGYNASRIFWSHDSFGEKVKYTVCTDVKRKISRRAKYCKSQRDINIRVDHTQPHPRVVRKLNQVQAYHNWLDSAPKYIDEYNEEWLYPCALVFSSDESSSGSDADVEDESVSEQEENFFKDYLTADTIQHLSACVEDLIPEGDWSLELNLTQNGVESETDLDTEAETEEDEELLDRIQTSLLSEKLENEGLDTEAETEEDEELLSRIQTSILGEKRENEILLDSETETEEDDELLEKIKASMRSEKSTNGVWTIPQVDGADSDSDSSYTTDEDSTTSDTSSEDNMEASSTQRRQPQVRKTSTLRQTRATSKQKSVRVTKTTKGPKKLPEKSSGASFSGKSTMAKKNGTNFGGRTLRSRQKLKEAKSEQRKSPEFKCVHCKKPFPSLSSVTRHGKWCKPKNKSNLKNTKKMRKSSSEETIEKSQRGRKSKKNLPIREKSKKKEPVRSNLTIEPVPSTSKTMLPVSKRLKIITKEEESETVKPNPEKNLLKVTNFDEITSVTTNQDYEIIGDENVSCKRCKNTYRTGLSYKNHLGNCFYFSSGSENEEEENAEHVQEPVESGINSNLSVQQVVNENESTETDSTTTSESSTSSEESLSPPVQIERTTEPFVSFDGCLSDQNREADVSTDNKVLEAMESKTEEMDLNENIQDEEIDDFVHVQQSVQNEPAESEIEQVIDPVDDGDPQDPNEFPTDTYSSNYTQFQNILSQFETKDCTVQLKEIHSVNSETQFVQVEKLEEDIEGQLDEETETESELHEEEIILAQTQQEVLQETAHVPVIYDIENQTLKPQFQDTSHQFWSENQVQPSLLQQAPHTQETTVQRLIHQSMAPNFPIGMTEIQHQIEDIRKPVVNLQPHEEITQSQQSPHQTQHLHQVQNFPAQNLQNVHVLQQLHQQTPQFQTVTIQDPTGQLITLQVPIVQQMTPNPSPQTFLSSNHQHQSQPYHHQFPFHQFQQEIQYEQYKQQIQAAIQLQRNSVQQQQQAILEQQQAQNQQLIYQQQMAMSSSVQNQFNVAPSSTPVPSTPILMPMNSHIFQNSHQNQHQSMATSQSPINAQAPTASSPETVTTYMVVQNGSTLSSIPFPYEPQSITNTPQGSTVQVQLTNSEFQGHRPQGQNTMVSIVSPETMAQPLSHSPLSFGTSHVELPNSTSVVCTSGGSNPGTSSAGPSAKPCPCPDCKQRSPPNFITDDMAHGMEQKKRTYAKHMGYSTWSLKQGTSAMSLAKKPKSGKIRARLASIVSERQGQGLQLFKSMTSPAATLPKLLPATVAGPIPTQPMSSTSGRFQSVTLQSQTVIPATTVTSDSFITPIVSASTVPSTLKAPTPTAVVRPMEHPLQKMSDQIQQIESTFTALTNNQAHVGLAGSSNIIPEGWISTPGGISPNLSSRIAQAATEAMNIESPKASEVSGQTTLGDKVPKEALVQEQVGVTMTTVVSRTSDGTAASQKPKTQDKSIKIQLKRQEGGDSYSINKISGSAATSNQLQGMFKTLKIKGKITTGDQAGTSTDVVVQPVVHTVPIPDPNAEGDDMESNRTIAEDELLEGIDSRSSLEASVVLPVSSNLDMDELGQPRKSLSRLTHRAVIVYEVKIDDKVQYKSCDVRAVWGYILERVQGTRRNHNLPPLAYPATNISLPENKREAAASFNKLGLTHRAVQFLLEQLPGVSKAAKEGHIFKFHEPPKTSIEDTPVIENPTGCARSEGYTGRKPFDMFGWLASKHRQPDSPATSSRMSDVIKGGSLPIAMKYRNLMKHGAKHLNVFWSSIHGRGLFTTKDIETGDVIIEYAGEVIRSPVCDLREKYYESKGIGCYMFRMDDNFVVDATLKGNAARFINHSCDPNCRSKIMDILGTKHILIFALRKIPSGEELTYDYKFEEEDGVKLPCSCGTHKCRKFLN